MKTLKIVVGLTVIILLLALVPFATILALNTLFPVLAIPFTWKTWLAVAFLCSIIKATITVDRK
jgi:hypothetical protein